MQDVPAVVALQRNLEGQFVAGARAGSVGARQHLYRTVAVVRPFDAGRHELHRRTLRAARPQKLQPQFHRQIADELARISAAVGQFAQARVIGGIDHQGFDETECARFRLVLKQLAAGQGGQQREREERGGTCHRRMINQNRAASSAVYPLRKAAGNEYTGRMTTTLVQDRPALDALCGRLAAAPWLALDTEFMRERTYFARLCLIQVATPDVIACVDPLAVDPAPLLELIYAPRALKVFHSARQDLEVLFDIRGALPTPLFDTQIAAALTAPEDQIGYGALVERITGHKLPKLHTRADWEKRPLGAEELVYAEDDVRYLRDVYGALHRRLAELGRLEWLAEECAALTDPALYRNDPDQAWRRLRAGQSLPPAAQSALALLAAWRERAARAQNLPRSWVMKDPVLIDLALRPPQTLEELAARDQVAPGAVRRWGVDILDALAQARARGPLRIWEESARLDQAEQQLYKELAARAQARAAEAGLSPTLLATRQDLLDLLRNREGRLVRGWRRTLLGEELLQRRAPTERPGNMERESQG